MGDGSSIGYNMSEKEENEEQIGSNSSQHSSTTTATSSFPLSTDFGIATILRSTVQAQSTSLLENKELFHGNDSSVITPYNFFTQSSPTTINKHERINDTTSTTVSSITINHINRNPTLQQQQPKKRKPSATVTSASLMGADELEFLSTNIKTELNPSFDISTTITTRTTINTERTVGTTTAPSSPFENDLNRSASSSTATTTDHNKERALKYSEFGIPLNPILIQPQSTIMQMLNANKSDGAEDAGAAENNSSAGGAPAAGTSLIHQMNAPMGSASETETPVPIFLPTLHDIGEVRVKAQTVVPPGLNPNPADDIANWIPFPPPASKRKRSSPFTPFQLEQLNHQIRMYTLANQLTIKMSSTKPLQPHTRARAKANTTNKDVLDEHDWLYPIVTSTRGRGKKNAHVTTVPVPPPPTRGRGKKNVQVMAVPAPVLFPPPPDAFTIPLPLPKPQRGRKRAAKDADIWDLSLPQPTKAKGNVRKGKGKGTSMPDLVPEVPLVFVECTFCATAIPTFDSLTIESCQHVFCRECLRNFIENNSEPQIPCPIRDEGKCNGVLSDPEIKELVTDEVFQTYLSRSLTSALEADSQLTHCFFPGCSGICLIEDGLRRFYCPVCSKLNCLVCKTTHESPCKKRRRKLVEEDAHGVSVIDLVNDSEAEEDEDEEGVQIAMKLPVAETEAEAKLRMEWEASWEQLVAKFNSGKEAEDESSETKPTVKNSLWNESESHFEVFSGIISTDHVFECPICFVDVEVGEGVILQECFHRFCRDCLAASIQHAEEPRVKCPYQSGNYSCQMHILDREVKLLVSDEVYDKLLKKSLSAAEMGMSNAFHCQSVNCTGWVEIDERVATFRCFICTKSNCVPCKAIHESLTCAEYQSRLREGECDVASKEELNRMISKGDAMRCPTCKVVIIKNGGCDGMTCVVCQTHICWATKGPRWGPKGRGDETGGCRCGFEGKKCHPKCGNCH